MGAAIPGPGVASIDFILHRNYPRRVPHALMRSLPAALGVGVVPLTYLTLRGLNCRPSTALLGSLFVTFDNGLITQSRLILLDSPLVFFTALTAFSWVGFSNEDFQRPFTKSWWLWLSFTGLSLGAVASCKWVGLLTFATLGVATLKQLWDHRGRLWIRHFLARAICLIVLPIMVYMAFFQIHFWILNQSGEGDSSMSPRFQSTLRGNEMNDTFAGRMTITTYNDIRTEFCLRCCSGVRGDYSSCRYARGRVLELV